MSRYDGRDLLLNDLEMYEEEFERRNVKFINQYGTPTMRYPTPEEISTLDLEIHVWTPGDRFFKLAHKHYGNSQMWWVIAWFNQTPTESHVDTGRDIYIPFPLAEVTAYMT